VPLKGGNTPISEIWIPKYRPDGSSYFAKSDFDVLTLKHHCEFILFNSVYQSQSKFRFCIVKPRLTNGKPHRTYKVVYIATNKPFDFDAVSVGTRRRSLSFAAKLNDTLYAFTAPVTLNARGMKFSGRYNGARANENLDIPLRQCIYSSDANKDQVFYICDGCEKAPPKSSAKKKKGFWGWVQRIFGG
jgi:hypothetical protein